MTWRGFWGSWREVFYVSLEFEKPVRELEARIAELHRLAGPNAELRVEISRLEDALGAAKKRIYSNLTPYQRVQVARHPERPNFRAYRDALADDFYELSGDRLGADDPAVRGGLAKIGPHPVVLLGHDKGDEVKSRVKSNFGMAHPEGYRKAIRTMQLADRHGFPIVTLVDTPGAHPGIAAEQHGQGGAIARSQACMLRLGVPTVAVVIGEGGSGGAIAIALADRVLMQQNAMYSVISPEGCAMILWRDGAEKMKAAAALKPDALHCLELDVIDAIVPEPEGGAHTDHDEAARLLGEVLRNALEELGGASGEELRRRRRARFRSLGIYGTRNGATTAAPQAR